MENQHIMERYELTIERVEAMLNEKTVALEFQDYFCSVAKFILKIYRVWSRIKDEKGGSLDELMTENKELYEELLGDNYESSFANPEYAVSKMGKELGAFLSFLYAEIRNEISFVYEKRLQYLTIYNELFIEIYNCFEQSEIPEYSELHEIIYWFMSDYCDVIVADRIKEQLGAEESLAVNIIMKSDLSKTNYLYEYGEYISRNEIETAIYLNSLDDSVIEKMAKVYVEGYRKGFEVAKIDLTKKETVEIRYAIGFERVVKRAVELFEEIGLKPAVSRGNTSVLNRKAYAKIGFTGTDANKQYEYDHQYDQGIFLDKKLIERKLDVMKNVYEQHKDLAGKFAGPALIETFGEEPFVPKQKEACVVLTKQQEQWIVLYNNKASQLVNQYIKGEERSFTIVAYPTPEIGEKYPEIFHEVIRINTLDAKLYEKIQSAMIDALDQGEYVYIKGKGENQTDLSIHLWDLKHPEKETKFENCVADVNIPVGEVFTSPKLEGTNGTLYVKEVYMNGLKYQNLNIKFENGMISDYTCGNFEKEEENKTFVKNNLLHNHDTLPMGEFAIGTNTTAYMVGKKYGIEGKYPILIAEKTGPHFAIGDTCYSWSEENRVYNPDGKEIVAKDNEVSILRKEDVSKAYFQCHTDITIPYDEIEEITVIGKEQHRVELIRDGRFVLEGTEALNQPFDKSN